MRCMLNFYHVCLSDTVCLAFSEFSPHEVAERRKNEMQVRLSVWTGNPAVCFLVGLFRELPISQSGYTCQSPPSGSCPRNITDFSDKCLASFFKMNGGGGTNQEFNFSRFSGQIHARPPRYFRLYSSVLVWAWKIQKMLNELRRYISKKLCSNIFQYKLWLEHKTTNIFEQKTY